ncbi:MAG: ParB N-terminal domain-containing protein [Phycisphaerae bacterium]
MSSPHTIIFLPLSSLAPTPGHRHPMTRAHQTLLAKHIAATGCYEPLIVRPTPPPPTLPPPAYEILHGHARAAILRRLGHTQAACLVWPWSDRQALLWRATIHHLAGREKASDRLTALQALLRLSPPNDLAPWLPEDRETLERLRHPAPHSARRRIAPVPPVDTQPEAFTIFLPAAAKRRLQQSLSALHPDAAQALLQLIHHLPGSSRSNPPPG